MLRQQLPDEERKHEQTDAAQGCSGGIEGSGVSSTLGTVQPFLFLAFALMLLHKRCAGRKDRGKSQEQSAYGRSEFLGGQAGNNRDCSAQDETDDTLVPFRLLDGVGMDLNLGHRSLA